jgi:hypothetical protein
VASDRLAYARRLAWHTVATDPGESDVIKRLEIFTTGVKILVPVLDAHSFHFEGESTRREPSLVGLGPEVAFGEFVRGDRRLLVEFVYSLGPVKYYVGDLWIEHAPYMRALGVETGENAYPGFSDDPFDAFRHLRTDLERFGSDFLAGDASILIRAASEEADRRPELRRRLMASYTGDDADRRRARELFRAQKYAEVVTVLESLKYPEFMDDFERRILEVARRKSASA